MRKLDYYKRNTIRLENEIKQMMKGTLFGLLADKSVEVESNAISSS